MLRPKGEEGDHAPRLRPWRAEAKAPAAMDLTRRLDATLLTAAAYAIATWIGLSGCRVTVGGSETLLLAPAPAVGLVAMLLLGRFVWPGVALAAFLVTMVVRVSGPGASTTDAIVAAAAVALGETGAVALAATVLRLSRDWTGRLDTIRRATVFVGVAVVGAGGVAAVTVAVGSSLTAGWGTFGIALAHGFASYAAGLLALPPGLMVVLRRDAASRRVDRSIEAMVCTGVLLAVGLVFFIAHFSESDDTTRLHFVLAVFPPVVWAAVRFGPTGAALACAGLGVWLTAGTAAGAGPFVPVEGGAGFWRFYEVVGVVGGVTLLLGAGQAWKDLGDEHVAFGGADRSDTRPRAITQPAEEPVPPRINRTPGRTALLAAGNVQIRSILSTSLTSLGYKLETAGDAEELNILLGDDPARLGLVVIDTSLPGLSESDVARVVERAAGAAPVVVLSDEQRDTLTRDLPGRVLVLPKPFPLSRFTEAIQGLTQGRA